MAPRRQMLNIVLLAVIVISSMAFGRDVEPLRSSSEVDSLRDICNYEDLSAVLKTFVFQFSEAEEKQTAMLDHLIKDNVKVIGHLDLLPGDYDKRQFPPRVSEDEVNQITVTMDIFSIPQLDEKLEHIMLEVRISHAWYDTRLKTEFDRPLELVPEAVLEFWTPDSYIHHAKDSKSVKLIKQPASLRITPDKKIQFTMMTMVTIGCPMSFHNYPMDQQTCRLELQSFGYNMNYNNYTWRRAPTIKQDINLDNHNVKIEEYTFTYRSDGMYYPGLGVRIELRRHLAYHMLQTYIPSVIFVVVAWLSFLVPSDVVPGRMVLCITTLLTLTSMFNSVRSITPSVSYMKAIDLWVFVCIFFVFSSLAEYGLILHLTSRSGWQKRVDKHVRGVTGRANLRLISPVALISVTSKGAKDLEKEREFDPCATGRRSGAHMFNEPPSATTDIPSAKDRLAYSIEWGIKIVYPCAFLLFNVIYWSYYLKNYRVEAEV